MPITTLAFLRALLDKIQHPEDPRYAPGSESMGFERGSRRPPDPRYLPYKGRGGEFGGQGASGWYPAEGGGRVSGGGASNFPGGWDVTNPPIDEFPPEFDTSIPSRPRVEAQGEAGMPYDENAIEKLIRYFKKVYGMEGPAPDELQAEALARIRRNAGLTQADPLAPEGIGEWIGYRLGGRPRGGMSLRDEQADRGWEPGFTPEQSQSLGGDRGDRLKGAIVGALESAVGIPPGQRGGGGERTDIGVPGEPAGASGSGYGTGDEQEAAFFRQRGLGQQEANLKALEDMLKAASAGGLRGGGNLNWSLPWRWSDGSKEVGDVYGGTGSFSQAKPIERYRVDPTTGQRIKVYGDAAAAQDSAIRDQMKADSIRGAASYWETLAMQTGNPRHLAAANEAKQALAMFEDVEAKKEFYEAQLESAKSQGMSSALMTAYNKMMADPNIDEDTKRAIAASFGPLLGS